MRPDHPSCNHTMQMTTPDYGASARARQLVGRYLTDDNLLPVAALLTSEIVTNAMRHGQPVCGIPGV